MSVDSTLLMQEVERVRKYGDTFFNTRMEVRIYANKKWMEPVRFDYYQLHRDYCNGQLGDIRTIEFLMLLGDFTYDLVPYRDNILVEVTEQPLLESNSERDWNGTLTTRRYKGILNMAAGDNGVLENKQSAMTSKDAMNQIGMRPVSLQLVEDLIYRMMMVSIGKTLRRTTTIDALMSLYTEYGEALGGTNDNRFMGRAPASPGWNTEVRHQIPFPDGMLLKDVGRYLQNEEGGVYPTGLGRYIQNRILYVYSLFDTTRYRKNVKVLNVINVPNDRYKGSEKTFLNTAKSITVLATGNNKIKDEGIAEKIQTGNALRFGDANKLLSDFTTVKDGRMLMDRASNIYDVVAEPLADGLNNVRWAVDRMTGNPYKQYTAMAQKAGQQFEIEWEKGAAELLEPGMPVKYQVIDGDTVKTYYGVLLGVTETRAPTDGAAVSAKFGTMVKLAMFLSRSPVDPSQVNMETSQ